MDSKQFGEYDESSYIFLLRASFFAWFDVTEWYRSLIAVCKENLTNVQGWKLMMYTCNSLTNVAVVSNVESLHASHHK